MHRGIAENDRVQMQGDCADTHDPDTDEALAIRAGRGDARAFELLVTRYEKYVYKHAYYITDNAEDAADLAQEIFLRLWRGLGDYRGDARFFSYLARVVHNVSVDRGRAKKTITDTLSLSQQSGTEDAPPTVPEPQAQPEEVQPELLAEKNERARLLHDAIAALSPEHRAVVILRDMEGYAYADIARMLSLDEGTVRSRLFRARSALRKLLEQNDFFT